MKENDNVPVAELKERLEAALTLRGKKPIDLATDLNIPKSAISQYLSGRSKNMDSTRLYNICAYLDVSEGWMMGFDVPIERYEEQKNSDAKISITKRFRKDKDFFQAVYLLNQLNPEQLAKVTGIMELFCKDSSDEVK